MGRSVAVLLTLALAVAVCSGCAIGSEQNRRTLNLLDAQVRQSSVTETSGSMAGWGIVYVPIGVAAAVADMVIVNPVCAIPAAARETKQAVWSNPSDDRVREVLMYTPKVIATPIVFAGYWAFFITFPVEYNAQDTPAPTESPEAS